MAHKSSIDLSWGQSNTSAQAARRSHPADPHAHRTADIFKPTEFRPPSSKKGMGSRNHIRTSLFGSTNTEAKVPNESKQRPQAKKPIWQQDGNSEAQLERPRTATKMVNTQNKQSHDIFTPAPFQLPRGKAHFSQSNSTNNIFGAVPKAAYDPSSRKPTSQIFENASVDNEVQSTPRRPIRDYHKDTSDLIGGVLAAPPRPGGKSHSPNWNKSSKFLLADPPPGQEQQAVLNPHGRKGQGHSRPIIHGNPITGSRVVEHNSPDKSNGGTRSAAGIHSSDTKTEHKRKRNIKNRSHLFASSSPVQALQPEKRVIPPPPVPNHPKKTGIKVAAPPGGVSHGIIGW